MEEKKRDFLFYDKLFMKITLWSLGVGFVLIGFAVILVNSIREVTDIVLAPVLAMLFVTGALFFIHLIRFFKYLIKGSKLGEAATITRSLLGLLITPVAFAVYYILIIIIAFASCTVT